jgi:hypothetical protein
MKKAMPYLITLGIAAAVLAGLAVTKNLRPVAVFLGLAARHQEQQVWWCPMHPFYKVKRYGICPY